MKIMQLGAVGILSLSLFSGAALAQHSYVGVLVGNTSVDESEFKDDTGLKLTFGYAFNQNFSVEVAYTDLGKFALKSGPLAMMNTMLIAELEAEYPGEDFSSVSLSSVDVSANGLELSANAFIPLNEKFSLFARAGVFVWDVKYRASVSGFGSDSTSDDGNDLFFGAGAKYSLTNSLELKAEFNRYKLDESDVDFLGVGLNFVF